MTWIQTFTGRAFDLLDPHPDTVDLRDIGQALSLINRFTGHTRRPYSVAEHSILVMRLVEPQWQLEALLHDATEAYVGDVSRPLKKLCPAYQEAEARVRSAIAAAYGLQEEVPEQVKEADVQALMIEAHALLGPTPKTWALTRTKHPDHDEWVKILQRREHEPPPASHWATQLIWEVDQHLC